MSSTHTLPINIFNLEGEEIMITRDNENLRTLGENWTHNPPNATCLSNVPTTELGWSRVQFLPWGMEIFFVLGELGFSSFQVENVYWKFMCAAH